MIHEAIDAIRAGEIVGLPTDTVYGVGVNPFDFDAVSRLFDLKGRPVGKPIGLLVADVDHAHLVGYLSDDVAQLAADVWPGALTLIVNTQAVVADWVGDRQKRTIGVRVPNHPVALELLSEAGPLAVTSANRSGEPETMSDAEARIVFGDGVRVYLEGVSPGGAASTVVDATGSHLVVLREGPIVI